VKQGDALSCALFIIAMEPLLRKLNGNPHIRPIILNPGKDDEESIITFSYADDITALCMNKEGVQIIIKIYVKTSQIKINYNFRAKKEISGLLINLYKNEYFLLYCINRKL